MKSNLFSKILGVGVSAGFVASSFLFAVPAAADTTEWSTINTPSWENGVILPASDILDYDISGEDGNTIYVIAEVDRACADENPFLDEIWLVEDQEPFQYALFKSTDGGVSWSDITQNVIDADNLPNFTFEDVADDDVDANDIFSLNYVAVAPDDEDWVAVTGYGNDVTADDLLNTFQPFTVASKDGGSNFAYTSDMEDTGASTPTEMDIVFDTEVSPETADGLHLIAAMGAAIGFAGTDMPGYVVPSFAVDQGTVYLLNAGTWLTGGWEDTSFWDGWDGEEDGNNYTVDKPIYSLAVIDGEFSPNFGDDCALVIIGDADDPDELVTPSPYVQTLDTCSEQWGEEASLPDPIQIDADGDDLLSLPGLWQEGIALPADYDAEDSGARVVFGYVNAVEVISSQEIGGFVFRIDNTDVSPQVAPSENPLLASIAVSGDADTGKMMIGEYIQLESDFFDGSIDVAEAEPCAGVRVWHTEELDICCPKWELCCKCPSGTYAARLAYTPDGSKEYATTTGSNAFHDFDGENSPTNTGEPGAPNGTPGDETAFSVSLDDATSWNQIGLIDTDIDKLSDYVICPDCSVAYLATLNDDDGANTECTLEGEWAYGCDSVWRTFDTGKTWERVNHGDWLEGSNWDGPELLLRLPCEDVENCCDYTDPSAPGGTIYLGVQDDDQIWYSRDCGQCWTKTQDTKIEIQDFAVDTESTVYVLDEGGNVSKSTNFGRRWSDSVDTGAGSGHMITVCCGQGMVVVGPGNWDGGDAVAWSDDAGDSWNTTDDIPIDGEVHVACATTCENIIYIAVDPQDDEESNGAIYRGDLTDGSWSNMNAAEADYTGIAVGRSDGTLYATTDYITYNEVGLNPSPCDRLWGVDTETVDYAGSGVARNLTPCDTACCGTEDWDYLTCGLGNDEEENFDIQVNALDICGCLTSATNTKLWAIDNQTYDVVDGSDGTVWTYEDCASKVGPTLLGPADGTVLDCMACADCSAQPFTLKWERMCNSCSYDIEIMDEDGNVVNSMTDIELTGTGSCSFVFNPQNSDEFSGFFSELVCGSSYKWHVREANTTCECIHSQWSATWTFTIATSSSNGVKLIAPEMAATNTGTANIGFSWTSVPGATSYSFVLSPNANLSGALVSQEIGTTAFNYAGPLENGKTYYWQVKAWKGTTLLSTSPIGVFTVGPKPVEPQPPVVVQQTPAPQINIPPAQQITPTWIYAIIGIGAALAVVVIVLIVRTRRP